MNKINIIESSITPRKVGKNVTIIAPCNIYDCEIGDNVFIGPFCEIQKNVKIGDGTRIQSHSFICENVEIGNNVFVGHNVTTINDLIPKVSNPDWIPKKTIIKDNASIGSGSVLLPIIIGENSLIAAGSIVTKNVADGIIVKNSSKAEFYKKNE